MNKIGGAIQGVDNPVVPSGLFQLLILFRDKTCLRQYFSQFINYAPFRLFVHISHQVMFSFFYHIACRKFFCFPFDKPANCL